jgi:hypothetical protein
MKPGELFKITAYYGNAHAWSCDFYLGTIRPSEFLIFVSRNSFNDRIKIISKYGICEISSRYFMERK